MKWITREHPKIDRIACPWLIKNFVDKNAAFIYVPKEQVFEKASQIDAIPYDLPGAEYSHYGEDCTFDFILKKHGIDSSMCNGAEISLVDGWNNKQNHSTLIKNGISIKSHK